MAKAKSEFDNDAFDDTNSDSETAGAVFGNEEDALLIDLNEVADQVFETLPKGIYEAILDQVEYQISKSSQKPMWSMRWTVTDGEFENRKLFGFLSFSEKALPGTKKAIAHFAPELLDGPFNPKKVADEGTLTGKKARLKVVVEKYEGEDRNRIRDILAPIGGDDGFAG